ncbi:hypothetical protein LPTSP2_17480 [Leptospira ellinghausenii]|uniref:Uncharacterized protein n=1 Tax=Leptospira ellinghausenii TaxID=1917822 RepID=A0A2P2DCV4_9LEPT|nr:hypothetical protein [Leptospira ellinghausenii]GBF42461.1 hypothetical protein LPTSP2_17480 [Leptospira ellinghausenii]
MWKFPKTFELSVSLEHLPMVETKLQKRILDWEEFGFQNFHPYQVTSWKTKPEALSHSSVSFDFLYEFSNFDSISFFLFPKSFETKRKTQLTEVLRSNIENKTKPKNKPKVWESIELWWKEPSLLELGNVSIVNASLDMDGFKNPIDHRHLQMVSGASKLLLRIGYLKGIQYKFHKKTFKPPYPKFGECYIKTRDTHLDKSLGKVYFSFLGYFFENQTDEYLLPFFGLKPLVPTSIRSQIPNEIWNQWNEGETTDWIESNLNGEEFEFRPVYQVSISSQHHLK